MFSKPFALTVSLQVLGLSRVKVYSPPAPDCAVRLSCVPTSTSSMVAFGTTAPLVSVTVPTTWAVAFCASRELPLSHDSGACGLLLVKPRIAWVTRPTPP